MTLSYTLDPYNIIIIFFCPSYTGKLQSENQHPVFGGKTLFCLYFVLIIAIYLVSRLTM